MVKMFCLWVFTRCRNTLGYIWFECEGRIRVSSILVEMVLEMGVHVACGRDDMVININEKGGSVKQHNKAFLAKDKETIMYLQNVKLRIDAWSYL